MKKSYNALLISAERDDGVFLMESNVCKSLHIGIKDDSIILLSAKNGNFCMSAEVLPDVIRELSEVHKTYFAGGKK